MYTMKTSVAVAKEASKEKGFSPTNTIIHRVRNEPERQLGSLRDVIGNIRRDGGTPSVDSIATELGGMSIGGRAPALLALQQTHGNRYVQRVVTGIQAKLKVGQPGDIYEQEADRVAEQVMGMPEPVVQLQTEEEKEKAEELIQHKPLSEQITPMVQRQTEKEEPIMMKPLVQGQADGGFQASHSLEGRLAARPGSGRPLPVEVRSFMEPRFRTDFSGVRVHTDSEAAQMTRKLSAQAFTHGSDVYFGASRYDPGTTAGKRLLAHELTHVVQQTQDVSLGLTGASAVIQRVNGEEETPSARQGVFPVNWDRSFSVGNYTVNVRVQGELQWSPFSIRITGEENGIFIRDGDEERASLRFGPGGEFQSLGVDTGAISAEFDREGMTTAGAEFGPATVEYERESRQVTITLDVLGAVWPQAMQGLVERVGEVTSDFTLVFHLPEGESTVRLASIGMDLGLTLGPEQLQAVAELSISTESAVSGLETTTAEATVEIQINVFGIEETIPIYEDAAKAGNIYMLHEAQLKQLALHAAFQRTHGDERFLAIDEETPPNEVCRAARWLQDAFNGWYVQAYTLARQRVIEQYTEEGFTDVEVYDSNLRPLELWPNARVIVDRRLREIIRQVILQTDHPGHEIARGIWDHFIYPYETAQAYE
jgi:hypothetical protein